MRGSTTSRTNPLLTPGEIENWRQTIIRARDWCRAHGIAYVFTIAPDKHVIYPEYFDPTRAPARPVSRADQVLTATLDTGVVDRRPAGAAGRQSAANGCFTSPTRTGTNAARFVAYQQIIEAVQRAVARRAAAASIGPRSRHRRRMRSGMDLAAIIGLKRVMREEDLRLVPKKPARLHRRRAARAATPPAASRIVTEIPGSTLPRAVDLPRLVHVGAGAVLSEHFSRRCISGRTTSSRELIEREACRRRDPGDRRPAPVHVHARRRPDSRAVGVGLSG